MNKLSKASTLAVLVMVSVTLIACKQQQVSTQSKVRPAQQSPTEDWPELHAVYILAVDHSQGLDLSGLTFCRGELLTISDKRPENIYRIQWSESQASLSPFIQLNGLKEPPGILNYLKPFDWEGISCDAGSNIYLVSESYGKVLKVKNGLAPQWLSEDFGETAKRAGLLQVNNGHFEGLVVSQNNGKLNVYLAAEREPYGFVWGQRSSNQWQVKASKTPDYQAKLRPGRNQDIAGMFLEGSNLYTLERNASSVCKRDLASYKVESCFQYKKTEESPEVLTAQFYYGQSEGLTLDQSFIYVILDNNNDPLATDASDKRGRLLIFQRPTGF